MGLIIDADREIEVEEIKTENEHKGTVTCMIFKRIREMDVLFTGSADRSIKLWEVQNSKNDPCFQTIIGCGGTILELKYVERNETLIGTSTDKTMRIWRLDTDRTHLYYPWFVPLQIIKDFTSINISAIDNNVWVTGIDVNDVDKFRLYAGDSEGSMLAFKLA